MVLNDYRDRADVLIEPIAKRLIMVSPNTLTWISLLFALLSGASYVITDRDAIYLVPAVLMLLLSALFDALDGKVARLTGTSCARGDLLDHVIDRYSDIFVLGGITLSPYCPEEVGFIAIISVLVLSYTGTQAQAVGVTRNYGGWLGRADRLMLLLIISSAQYLLITGWDTHEVFGYYPLGWLMLLFIVVGNLNAIQRVYDTWCELGEGMGPDASHDSCGPRGSDGYEDIEPWTDGIAPGGREEGRTGERGTGGRARPDRTVNPAKDGSGGRTGAGSATGTGANQRNPPRIRSVRHGSQDEDNGDEIEWKGV